VIQFDTHSGTSLGRGFEFPRDLKLILSDSKYIRAMVYKTYVNCFDIYVLLVSNEYGHCVNRTQNSDRLSSIILIFTVP
jgi:hypothetical protein